MSAHIEARRSSSRQSTGADVRSLLYPVANEREALKRQGLQPKNHHKENIKAIHGIQMQRMQQAARPATAPEPFKIARFKAVESVVRRELVTHTAGASSEALERPSTADAKFMRKGEGQLKREKTAHDRHIEGAKDEGRLKIKPPVPTRNECMEIRKALTHRAEAHEDYIRRNALDAIRGTPDKAAAAQTGKSNGPLTNMNGNRPTTPTPRHNSFGKVPTYILKRKEEMLCKQAERAESLLQHPSDCPLGMRLVKDEERNATREELERVRLGLLKALSQLPFIIDTPSLQTKKATLEEKLVQVEKACAIYSRQRIFVEE